MDHPSPAPIDLPLHLTALRHELQLTQEDFAERAGITYKYYQAIEGGRRSDLRLSTLTKLALAHGMKLSEFIFRLEQDAPALALVAERPARYRAKRKTNKSRKPRS